MTLRTRRTKKTYRVITSSTFHEHQTFEQVEGIIGRKLTPSERKSLKSWPVGDSFMIQMGFISIVREN